MSDFCCGSAIEELEKTMGGKRLIVNETTEEFPIDWSSPLETLSEELLTRSGLPVRIYAVNPEGQYPIHGAYLTEEVWEIGSWRRNGKWAYFESCKEYPLDLVVKGDRELTGWLIIHDIPEVGKPWATFHGTIEDVREVRKYSPLSWVATVPFSIKFRKGEKPSDG